MIDIPETQTVIVIENKTFTTSHDDQLTNYQKYIDESISGFSDYQNKFYVYLSPDGKIPINYGGDERYNNAWCILDYRCILQSVNEVLTEIRKKRNRIVLNGCDRRKLIFIMEDYVQMIKTDILLEKTVLEECKRILDDKKAREAFALLIQYTQTATEENVLPFVREYLGAVGDGNKSQRWFYTVPMKEFFERQGEKITNRLCRCVCQPIGAQGGIVGFDICISLEKCNGNWTEAQKKILNMALPNGNWQNKVFSGPEDSRVVLLTAEQREQPFESIKPKLVEQLQKFKAILNDFEAQLSEIV